MPTCTSQTKTITDHTTPVLFVLSGLQPIPACRVWRQTSFDTRPLDKIRSHDKDSKRGRPLRQDLCLNPSDLRGLDL
jgi:hypothetical protein